MVNVVNDYIYGFECYWVNQYFMSEWIFLTGGCGFFGSHIAAHLKSRTDYRLMLIDHAAANFPHVTKYCDLFADEPVTSQLMLQAVTSYQPRTLIHCTDSGLYSPTKLNPGTLWTKNVIETIELLKVAIAAGVKNVIFFSTSDVYANSDLPRGEHSHLLPLTSNGRSRLSVEYFLKDCYVAHGINSISFRTFGISGSHHLYDLGHLRGAPFLIPKILESMLTETSMQIFGRDFNTVDGTAIRDYLHISDLTDAVELGLKYLDANHGAYTMNLGSGIGTSVQEMVDLAETLLGKPVPYSYGDWRVGDNPICTADISTIKQALDWQPKRTNRDMILDAWKWYQSETYRQTVAAGLLYNT